MEAYKSLKDHVYQYISKELQEGHLSTGDKINEQRISETLGVSRTPVREALIQLASEGVLQSEPRRGFTVSPVSLESAKEIYSIIGTLDAMAAALAINRLHESDLEKMHRLHAEMQALISQNLYDEYDRCQRRFHDVYTLKCGNAELIRLLDQLRMRFIKQGSYTARPENLQQAFLETNREHLQIIRLLAAGKKEPLQKYVKEVHWSELHANFEII